MYKNKLTADCKACYAWKMPTKKKGRKTLTVYPTARALSVLGTGTPGLNQALECWADLIARASVENAKRFRSEEWQYLADCANGIRWEPTVANPGKGLAQQASDAHELEGPGSKWLARSSEVAALAKKLGQLSYVEAWALILAVQSFWDNHERIDREKEEWWSLVYRSGAKRDESRAEKE
jgi:hypothetical protein